MPITKHGFIVKNINDLAPTIRKAFKIAKTGRTAVFLGDGVPVFRDRIREALGEKAYFAPAPQNRQRAACVAALGALYMKEGKAQPADDFDLTYLRDSQAERVRKEKLAASAAVALPETDGQDSAAGFRTEDSRS